MQERIERSTAGRALLSVLLVVLLGSMAIANLPPSHLRETAGRATDPVLAATGLGQRWSIFAPYPRSESLALEASIAFRDGRQAVWRPPTGGALLGAYWDYRWRKLEESAKTKPEASGLLPGMAAFAARQVARPDREPVRVTLWAITRQPGKARERRALFRAAVGFR